MLRFLVTACLALIMMVTMTGVEGRPKNYLVETVDNGYAGRGPGEIFGPKNLPYKK